MRAAIKIAILTAYALIVSATYSTPSGKLAVDGGAQLTGTPPADRAQLKADLVRQNAGEHRRVDPSPAQKETAPTDPTSVFSGAPQPVQAAAPFSASPASLHQRPPPQSR